MTSRTGGSAEDEGIDQTPDASDAVFADPSRRTYLAQERTLLAWWRTALGTMAVAVGIGGVIPKLTDLPDGPFVALGAGYLGLSLWFVLMAAYRQRTGQQALAQHRYVGLSPRMVTALTVYLTGLVAATGWVMFWGPG